MLNEFQLEEVLKSLLLLYDWIVVGPFDMRFSAAQEIDYLSLYTQYLSLSSRVPTYFCSSSLVSVLGSLARDRVLVQERLRQLVALVCIGVPIFGTMVHTSSCWERSEAAVPERKERTGPEKTLSDILSLRRS